MLTTGATKFLDSECSAQRMENTSVSSYRQCLRLLGLLFVRMKKNGGEVVEMSRHILRGDCALALLSRGTFILTNLSYTPATLYALFRYMQTNTKVERHASGQWSSHEYTALRSANFGQKVAVLRRPKKCQFAHAGKPKDLCLHSFCKN